MKIQNPAYKNKPIRLRYAAETVVGDERGIFDIPEKDAQLLLSARGGQWRKPASRKASAPAAAPAPAPEPPASEPPPPADPEPPADDSDGPDLDSLDKAGLLKVAEEYAEAYDLDVKKSWGEKRIREYLTEKLYGEA